MLSKPFLEAANKAYGYKWKPTIEFQDNIFAYVKGMKHGTWVIADGRSNGYNNTEAIVNPAYIIESLIRDWAWRENNLKVRSASTGATKVIENLNQPYYDDYYNGAYLNYSTGATNHTVYQVTDYDTTKVDYGQVTSVTTNELLDGTQNFLTTCGDSYRVVNTDTNATAFVTSVVSNTRLKLTDHIMTSVAQNYEIYRDQLTFGSSIGNISSYPLYLTNVLAGGKRGIDITSFDAIGNTTNGSRNGWVFRNSLTDQMPLNLILQDLLFESFLLLDRRLDVDGNEYYYLYALDEGTSVGTFSNPLSIDGMPQISWALSSLEGIYNRFDIGFQFDYGANTYRDRYQVSKDKTSDTTYLGATYQSLCREAEKKYRVNRTFTYDSRWIGSHYGTKVEFTRKLIKWFTQRKMIVTYAGSIQSHIQYTIGDQVLINYPDLIPTGKNNSTKFMIVGKEIIPDRLNPYILFKLVEMI